MGCGEPGVNCDQSTRRGSSPSTIIIQTSVPAISFMTLMTATWIVSMGSRVSQTMVCFSSASSSLETLIPGDSAGRPSFSKAEASFAFNWETFTGWQRSSSRVHLRELVSCVCRCLRYDFNVAT